MPTSFKIPRAQFMTDSNAPSTRASPARKPERGGSRALTIRDLRVRAVKVPMREPHKTASGTIVESPLVLTDVVTEEGVVGHSYVFAYTALALKPIALLIKNLEPLIAGHPVAPFDIERMLSTRFRLLGPQGLTGIAMAAVDMALWDALARASGLSLARLLGGAPKPVPAYGAVGFDGVSDSARVAAAWAERGLRGVKAKIGYADVREDVEVIRAMRREIGDRVAVMVDYNQSLLPSEAIERGRYLDDEQLGWIEEPTRADDYEGHAHIARALRTPIQCGENWWGPHDLAKAVHAEASDYVMPDVMKIGGVTGWMRAAALADTHGIRMSNHLFVEISAQLLAVTPTAHWLEYCDWFSPIIENPLRIDDGNAIIDERPGSGIEWNEDAVLRYLVE
ncbi:MAG TPA: enolase C-terminal domain-like protein [Casimicrobiaceae bacterium]|nr:enolase C-terminal domain-like protein [Casimicrobiaceae bacterium]